MEKEEFLKLNRKRQLELLDKDRIKYDKKDKEIILWEKYYSYNNPQIKEIVEILDAIKDREQAAVSCPNCSSIHEFKKIKEWEYKCEKCGKGYSGFPPPVIRGN